MTNHRILAVTGTRADYGIYVPVFHAIEDSKALSIELAVVGMHLLPAFGHTVDEIIKDGFPITAKVDTLTADDTVRSMAEYVGRTTIEFARILAERKPDVLLVLGDRGEMLAAATAALYEGIPIAHLHGGEHSGSVDDPVRHAITQMASIHFTSTETHAKNVQRMIGGFPSPLGGGPGRGGKKNIYVVGAPALDVIRTLVPTPKDALCKKRNLLPTLPTLLFVQHPDTTEDCSPEEQLQPSLDAVQQWAGNILLFGANADAGGVRMNALLEKFAKEHPHCAFVVTLPHQEFLSWESYADILVGNSSSGIIESASFHLPVVNIGDRQKGRTQSGNVLNVPYDRDAIEAAIHKALTDTAFQGAVAQCQNIYGDGHAAEKIVGIFESLLPSSL